MAGLAPRAADRSLVLRDQWSDVRSPLGTRRRASRATSCSRARRSQTPVRATSTPPRARSRTSTRGRRPERDSASARSRKSWGDFGLSPRHRQRGGDRSRALAATADDSGSSRAAPLALPREAKAGPGHSADRAGPSLRSWRVVTVLAASPGGDQPGARIEDHAAAVAVVRGEHFAQALDGTGRLAVVQAR
jgi:hypothetical protein